MKLIIVESPAKAKTLEKYLGKDYKVLATYGHIRDLPSKSGSVEPENNFLMHWEIAEKSQKQINEIKKNLKKADQVILATDPDREGEAIAWHVKEILNLHDPKRIAFHAVTKSAVTEAINNPRNLSQALIDAYLARRALDYLVGFTLSPILWRKLPGSRSAGRVQSVALRLITEREAEIEKFKSEEYWSIEALFKTTSEFNAKLTHFHGKKLEKFSIKNETQAFDIRNEVLLKKYTVANVETKKVKRNPSAPFMTSTLQQEASRKLGFTARKTMQLAQTLYEGVDIAGETIGLITYMRTDSVIVTDEALTSVRELINNIFGESYVSKQKRVYKTKVKNAQEAHEAIRPTYPDLALDKLKQYLSPDLFSLYNLIWKRMLASQMESAEFNQVAIDLSDETQEIIFRSNGSTLLFDGFLKLYEEGKESENDSEENQKLPSLKKGEIANLLKVSPLQHFTQPPPRYTEAGLVKKMEELGIGRPSTYANIIHVLQDREYVEMSKKCFIPKERGRLVSAFLSSFFSKYVEYTFTADLEQKLDDISNDKLKWDNTLSDFWSEFKKVTDEATEVSTQKVLSIIDQNLEQFLFPTNDRSCPSCEKGTLGLKRSKFGAFIGCSNYPECKFTRKLTHEEIEEVPDQIIGTDPQSKEEIILKKGKYGYYLQLGELKKVSVTKPSVSLSEAIILLSLPKEIGIHPETKEPITVGVGRFGAYIKHQKTFASVKKIEDIPLITINEAITKLEMKISRKNK